MINILQDFLRNEKQNHALNSKFLPSADTLFGFTKFFRHFLCQIYTSNLSNDFKSADFLLRHVCFFYSSFPKVNLTVI